jgi:hypothetical protein
LVKIRVLVEGLLHWNDFHKLTTRIFLLNKHFRIIITVCNAQFYREGLKAYTTLQEYIQIKQRTQAK